MKFHETCSNISFIVYLYYPLRCLFPLYLALTQPYLRPVSLSILRGGGGWGREGNGRGGEEEGKGKASITNLPDSACSRTSLAVMNRADNTHIANIYENSTFSRRFA